MTPPAEHKEESDIERILRETGDLQIVFKNVETKLAAKKIELKEAFEAAGERTAENEHVKAYTSVKKTWAIPKNLTVTMGLEDYPMDEVKAAQKSAETNFKDSNPSTGTTVSLTVAVKEVVTGTEEVA